MKCLNCNIDMPIDHSAYLATGDNSPQTPTELFTVLYYACHNPACPLQGQLVKGENIPLQSAFGTQTKIEGAQYCCGEVLCIITNDTFKVAPRADASASLNHATQALCIPCPTCGKAHTFDVTGKTNRKEF